MNRSGLLRLSEQLLKRAAAAAVGFSGIFLNNGSACAAAWGFFKYFPAYGFDILLHRRIFEHLLRDECAE